MLYMEHQQMRSLSKEQGLYCTLVLNIIICSYFVINIILSTFHEFKKSSSTLSYGHPRYNATNCDGLYSVGLCKT